MTPLRSFFALATLAGCVLVAHWPIGRVDFVYDDEDFIVANPAAHSLAAAARAALRPFPPDQPGRRLYRPVTALSYGLDYSLGEGRARGFALTNVALYVVVVLLAWRFLAILLPSGLAAWLAAMLFAVHPAHAEAVDAIAGRSELLALLFVLVSIMLYLGALGAPRAPGARSSSDAWPFLAASSALAYALACGSKETAVILPAVLAAFGATAFAAGDRGPARARRAVLALGPHLLVLAAYLVIRRAALGGFLPIRTVLGDAGASTRVWTAGSVYLEYLRLLVVPARLQVDGYYLKVIGIVREPDFRAVLGLALLAATVLLAGALARRSWRREPPDEGVGGVEAGVPGVFEGLVIFIGFLLPVSHLLPMGALMAERFLFAPSLGFVLAVTAAALPLGRRLAARPEPAGRAGRAIGALLLAVLVGLGVWRARERALEWRDAVRLWESADRAIPGSSLVKTNLAAELIVRGDLDGAERVLLALLETSPGAGRATYNLALVARGKGDLPRAAALLEEVVRRDPADVAALLDLAEIEARRPDRERAHHVLQQAKALARGGAFAARIAAIEALIGDPGGSRGPGGP